MGSSQQSESSSDNTIVFNHYGYIFIPPHIWGVPYLFGLVEQTGTILANIDILIMDKERRFLD